MHNKNLVLNMYWQEKIHYPKKAFTSICSFSKSMNERQQGKEIEVLCPDETKATSDRQLNTMETPFPQYSESTMLKYSIIYTIVPFLKFVSGKLPKGR